MPQLMGLEATGKRKANNLRLLISIVVQECTDIRELLLRRNQ
jgi:hypothetical protein